MKSVLTMAGSDPSGGAGLQADLKVFISMGTYGLSIPTVLTAQNSEGVIDIQEVSSDFFMKQFDVLLSDIYPDAVKIGMVYTSDIVEIIARKVREKSLVNVVLDPVTVSSSGSPLLKEGTLKAIRDHLFPVSRVTDMKSAAVKLLNNGSESVIITGGHLKDRAIDLLFDGEDYIELESNKLEGDFHGTGCVFSSAVAAGLALGYDVRESAVKSKDLVLKAMESAIQIGKGMKMLNL
jgi:hydroxymethylpyrimidine/phosphomethylpyrimidine kinase